MGTRGRHVQHIGKSRTASGEARVARETGTYGASEWRAWYRLVARVPHGSRGMGEYYVSNVGVARAVRGRALRVRGKPVRLAHGNRRERGHRCLLGATQLALARGHGTFGKVGGCSLGMLLLEKYRDVAREIE